MGRSPYPAVGHQFSHELPPVHLNPMGATLKRFPHGATTGPRPQRPGRRYGQVPHRPGPDRPVGRLLLTEDLTRWADATARLYAETDAREDAAHLESLWVLEDA